MYTFISTHWISILCTIINIALWIEILRINIKGTRLVNVRTFYVKAAFAFESKEGMVALCQYYNENALHEQANDLGLNFGDYMQKNTPDFKFEGVKPLSSTNICKYNLPGKLIAAKKNVETKPVILLTHGWSIFVMIKPEGEDPFKTYWIGTCIQTDNQTAFNRIVREYRRREKNGTCNIVRS